MALAKAHYTPDRTAAMDTVFNTSLKGHLGMTSYSYRPNS